MAYKITDECIGCGTCAGECPVSAISEGEFAFISHKRVKKYSFTSKKSQVIQNLEKHYLADTPINGYLNK